MKRVIERILGWLGLIRYKTRTQHKHHIRTIKRPINDCKLYGDTEYGLIMELKEKGQTDKQIGKAIGRTEGAIRQMRYMKNKDGTL